jgi:hypothetical protein
VESYHVELHLPPGGAAELAAAADRARSTAEQLTQEGIAVRWVRSVYVPEDETCVLVFEASSPDAVDEASRRASLSYVRIVDAEMGRAGRPHLVIAPPIGPRRLR